MTRPFIYSRIPLTTPSRVDDYISVEPLGGVGKSTSHQPLGVEAIGASIPNLVGLQAKVNLTALS